MRFILSRSICRRTSPTVPVMVLAETPGAWDSAYTCNPKVIGGVFDNPLGDGQTYSFAMYYVATSQISGANNSIGVAFSNDGIVWKKYPQPVIPSTSQTGYGVGQPALYNADHKAAISMFYEEATLYRNIVSRGRGFTDGVHFTVQGTLTSKGLDPDNPQPSWGDMAYDSKAGEWYAVFNRPLRPPSTTGGVLERGQYGIELYKIRHDALLTGASPWQQLVTIGHEYDWFRIEFHCRFCARLLRQYRSDILSQHPMYTSISYPPPNWDATPAEAGTSATFQPGSSCLRSGRQMSSAAIPLDQYFNGSIHEVTTGWVSTNGGFQLQEHLGHLYANPLHGATVPFYGCKRGQTDYFVSLDIGCEGQRILGKNGYGYSQPVSGLNLIALYRCSTRYDHFVSKDPKCEGQTTDEFLGYVVP